MPRAVHVISTPSGIGGAERIVVSLVREAPSRGWEEHVLNPIARGDDPALLSLLPKGTYEGHPVRSVFGVPRARTWLRDRLTDLKPDVVHAHLFHASVLAGFGRVEGPRYIVTHHHGDVHVWRGRHLRARLDRQAIKRFDRVVAVSQGVAGFLIDTYGCPADKVTVIRNGWAGTPLPRSPSTVPTVVSVGNLRPEKGHKVLLKAFEKVVKELPVARLVLVGEGPLRGELEDVVTDLGLVGNVEFAGARPEVWSSLATADVFALASFSEPLGLAVLEAMAAGLPVVATSVGGVPELVTTNVTGKLVPSGDEGALSAALLGFLRDKRSAEKMGRESRKRADSMRATAMIDSYFSLYEEMLDGGGRNDGIRSGRYPDGGKP